MTVVDTRENAIAEAEAVLSEWMTNLVNTVTMTEAEVFAGLDGRTVGYLRERLAENPDLWGTLCQAAQYRRTHQRERRVSTTERSVYFIAGENSGLIKIGSAADPAARLSTLQTGSPERLRLLATTTGGEQVERELHRQFAESRAHGEWFHPTPALTEYIGGLS